MRGTIRNIHGELEDVAYADALLDLRLRHRDLSIRCLEQEADRITRENPAPGSLRCWATLDRALQADPLVDFRFWVERFRKELDALSPWMRRTLYTVRWCETRTGRYATESALLTPAFIYSRACYLQIRAAVTLNSK